MATKKTNAEDLFQFITTQTAVLDWFNHLANNKADGTKAEDLIANDNNKYEVDDSSTPWNKVGDLLTNYNKSKESNNSSNVNNQGNAGQVIKLRSDTTYQDSFFKKNGTYTSFSGADAVVTLNFKNGKPIIVGECQTLTYSIYRPTVPVYALGTSKPKGYTKGPRTVAGTLIFTVFDRHVLLSALKNAYGNKDSNCLNSILLADQIPPFDIQITFLNEYGQSSLLAVHEVRITSEGQTMSIEDMLTENTMQYLATDITLMTPDVYESN